MSKHHITIRTGKDKITRYKIDTPTYGAVCDCGWESPPYINEREAETDGDEHVLAMQEDHDAR